MICVQQVLVNGVIDCAVTRPNAGDVALFNSRNPREVAGGPIKLGRERISSGSFLGRMADRLLAIWA